jgi:CDP-glycerol glycerophosphotransferase (TagB/SpsB family)
MDSVLSTFNAKSANKGAKLPDDFSKGKATLLYAPTWHRFLTSVEMLGNGWLDRVRQAVPELNIIIKPHPHIPKVFPKIVSRWRQVARDNERILMVEGNADIYQYFLPADIILSDASSVIFYFLALDRPIILVNNPLRFKAKSTYDPEGPEWAWRDVGIQINHVDELEGALVRALKKPEEKAEVRAYYREKIFGDLLDGRAAERIADKVRSLINPRPEDEWVSRSWKIVDSRQPVNRLQAMISRIRLMLSPLSLSLEPYPRLKYCLLRLANIFTRVR